MNVVTNEPKINSQNRKALKEDLNLKDSVLLSKAVNTTKMRNSQNRHALNEDLKLKESIKLFL